MTGDRLGTTRRTILRQLADGPRSGEAIATELDITRAAVWKHIDGLREAGFVIDSSPEGYRVLDHPDYGAAAIEYELEVPLQIEFHPAIGSTNDRAKDLATAGERDIAVIAETQRSGRGRRGRKWAGPAGGIYLSCISEPQLTPMDTPIVTQIAALATVDALQNIGVDAGIKWPNDILVRTDGREHKIAGVLTETRGELDRVAWVVVGIGLNANVDADDIPAGATSIRALRKEDIDRRQIVQSLLRTLYQTEANAGIIEAVREHSWTIGNRVTIDHPDGSFSGFAVDIEWPGTLLVEVNGTTRAVTVGECVHLHTRT